MDVWDKTIEFTVNGKPVGKARPRVVRNAKTGKVHAYTPETSKNYELSIGFAARAYMRGKDMLDQPLKLSLCIYMPIPKSWTKKKREEYDGKYHDKKPDQDNIIKAVCDAMNGIVYTDDRLIVEYGNIKKVYSIKPRVEIKLEVL